MQESVDDLYTRANAGFEFGDVLLEKNRPSKLVAGFPDVKKICGARVPVESQKGLEFLRFP